MRTLGLAVTAGLLAGLVSAQPAQATAAQDQFIASSVGPAQSTNDTYDVPISVTIAQAALESGWGGSTLSENDRNYFGFKCVSATDPGPIATGCHNYPTTECTPTCHTENAYFRVYASRTDSYRDYGRLLTTSSAYSAALPFRHDPDAFIEHVAVHYATDPDYAAKVKSIMQAHDLYQYDGTAVKNSGAAVYVPGNNYHVFGIKQSSGTLYQRTWNSSWGDWQALAGDLRGSPAVTYHDGRYDVFAISSTNAAMYQKTFVDGAWGSWHSIGGTFNTNYGAAAIYENGDYHVFGVSPAGTLFQRTWNGSWGDWQNLAGDLVGTPAVTYHNGRFDVFARSTNGAMYQKTFDSGWGSWHSIGGQFQAGAGAAAVYDNNGAYHVFGIAPDGTLFQRTWNGSWGDWQNLGGTITGTPAVTYHNGRFDVFAISPVSGYAMYQKTFDSGWGSWHSIGGDFS